MNNKLKKVIIATGGTGGHVFPAYSLAKHFITNKINVEIISGLKKDEYVKVWNITKPNKKDRKWEEE